MGSAGGVLRQLGRELFGRVGFGTLLITIGGAVSLGMVPNIVEAVAGPWVVAFVGIFVLSVLVVFAGWWMRRDRGVGVVVWLMPGTGSPHRLTDSIADAAARHGTLFAIQRDRLWPDHRRLPALRDRVDVAHWQIQDRLHDCASGPVSSTHVSLYVHAHLPETFALGRRMISDSYGRLDVMHFAHRAGDSFVRVLELDNRLTRATDAADRSAIEPWLTPASMRAEIQQHGDVAEDYRHRLMLIVNLTRNTNAVATAREVARTGEVVAPDGSHTGYYFDAADPRAPGPPCKAYVEIETKGEGIPDTPQVYEPMVRHILERWREACRVRRQELGGRPVQVVLALSAPAPFALALGRFIEQSVIMLPHSMELVRGEEPVL
ncbi:MULTISPECIES: MFS transporter [unclassified Streptomyces]|uniref:MFS transporter n=1 Tax=unclassified Streptomyces TaxID=2593676 RepID=UPI0011B946B9|nr:MULTISPECIES: MFS transporter [unclassified Streptomyces]